MAHPKAPVELLESADVARILGLTPTAIRVYGSQGRLRAAAVTPRGSRLYRRRDVERFAAQRKQAASAA
jgi:DNA-binding transcriptional MerR regulator